MCGGGVGSSLGGSLGGVGGRFGAGFGRAGGRGDVGEEGIVGAGLVGGFGGGLEAGFPMPEDLIERSGLSSLSSANAGGEDNAAVLKREKFHFGL